MTQRRSKLKQALSLEGDVDSEGSWAISYGDLVTLLLTFFILFFNVSQKTQESKKEVQSAILVRLGDAVSVKTEPQGHPEDAIQMGSAREADGLEQQVVREWGGKAQSVGSRIVIEFPDVSFFGFAGTSVTERGEKMIQEFTRRYLPYAGQNILSIKAFTDNVKVSRARSLANGRPYIDNLELSALRSIATMRIIQKAGVPLDRMRISGNGEFSREIQKVASSHTGSVRGDPLSRKIVLIIESETKEKL